MTHQHAVNTDTHQYITDIAKAAKQASFVMASADTATKNHALMSIKQAMMANKAQILQANAQDVAQGRQAGLDDALLDRLLIDEKRFGAMMASVDDVLALQDPIGQISQLTQRPSGIMLGKMQVPLGVIGMIYESRPNVTLEAASLAIKSGNAIILKGGSEALLSNQAIARCIQQGLQLANLPTTAVQAIAIKDRAVVDVMIRLSSHIDVIIPRGGRGLIEHIASKSCVPVIKHLDGNCHTFIDANADDEMAIAIAVNAKTSRYGTCNTMETLLIHQDKLALLPIIIKRMWQADEAMSFRVCPMGFEVLESLGDDRIELASQDDWWTEYLSPILAIKVVKDADEAICHINHYGSHHTDVIVSNDYALTQKFIRQVDSASVMVNASSRFADGFEYGLGAEIGISTDKIHARGPVGLDGLTSHKWVVFGQGQIRS